MFRARRFLGLRVGRSYFMLQDRRVYRELFSERNRIHYRPIVKIGDGWELSVKR